MKLNPNGNDKFYHGPVYNAGIIIQTHFWTKERVFLVVYRPVGFEEIVIEKRNVFEDGGSFISVHTSFRWTTPSC